MMEVENDDYEVDGLATGCVTLQNQSPRMHESSVKWCEIFQCTSSKGQKNYGKETNFNINEHEGKFHEGLE